jgi:rhamnosyltransferase
VGAVVAAFGPGDELVAAVQDVLAQVDAVVVVVDEHPVGAATRQVLDACRAAGAHVAEHDANRGIGAALNTGTAALQQTLPGLGWVLTLDQDSRVPEGYVPALLAAAYAAERAGTPVGMVAPDAVGSILRLPARPRRDGVVLGGEPIQSGLLVPTGVLERLDGFDESLFIDGVDTDFYLRARDLGLRCVVAPGTRLEHRLGQAITVGAGHDLPFLVASTFRYHYQWRNLVTLLRRHARRHPAWALRAVGRAARHLAIVTVLTGGRRQRLREARSGVRAGLAGERGRRPGAGGAPPR